MEIEVVVCATKGCLSELLFTIFLRQFPLCFQLLNARDMAQKKVIGQDEILYRTDKDLVEQDFEARDWDKRFRDLERSD